VFLHGSGEIASKGRACFTSVAIKEFDITAQFSPVAKQMMGLSLQLIPGQLP